MLLISVPQNISFNHFLPIKITFSGMEVVCLSLLACLLDLASFLSLQCNMEVSAFNGGCFFFFKSFSIGIVVLGRRKVLDYLLIASLPGFLSW